MPVLSIDIETYSSVSLKDCGVYRYVEAPDFQILLFAYAVDDEPVQVIDLTQQALPDWLVFALSEENYIKAAYNANFERTCLTRYLQRDLGLEIALYPEQWRCTAVHAATLGLPRSLGEVGKALGLPEDKQKMKEGTDLIRYFCVPCKPTKANGGRTRNLPMHAPEKWQLFKDYNIRDVETERTIRNILDAFPVREDEWEAWWMDQRINDRGILVDMELAEAAIAISDEHMKDLTEEATLLTGLGNVKSVSQLKRWLGHEGSLNKETVSTMRDSGELDGDSDRVLAIRQELGKTSVTKYEAMKRSVCADGRVRGLFQFYGANRTGRWAGRLVQVQNLPQNHIEDLELARAVAKDRDRDGLQALYGNVPSTLSELIRTAFVAEPGHTFVVVDFSAIEARVIAWLADEKWRQDVFAQGGDIYCASASQMFGVLVEKHGQNSHLRQKGKIAELALGYGGSVGALVAFGAKKMGIPESELLPIVQKWRAASPNIVNLWWQIDRAARETIETGCTDWRYDLPHGLSMRMSRKMLHIRLPSGRELRYWKPRIEADDQGRENITYGSTEAGKWSRVFSYGPKLVENIVQATARDCLRDAMQQVHDAGGQIVMHVHDEVVIECPECKAEAAFKETQRIMGQPIPWAPGLLLRGDGYITPFYKKD